MRPNPLKKDSFRHIRCLTKVYVENTPWLNSLQAALLILMEIRDILARNLKRYRQALDLSQEELAHRAQIDRTYVSSLERSVYGATIDVVDRLAVVLGVTTAGLLTLSAATDSTKPRPAEPGGVGV
jgi:ribosome-binding protein aMBF1 (putative translation factor)